MQCKLCDAYFADETSFFNLFTFPSLCPSCTHRYRPSLYFEDIPIDRGYLRYLYLYTENSLNKRQRDFLGRHFHIAFEQTLKEASSREVILIVDETDFTTLGENLTWVLAFRYLRLISLVRYPLEDFMNFY